MSVKLYVYDLSNGMAQQMSRQLTGRQIDGIWHTSVVVFGKEIFYGQGIDITLPGRSHHGRPHQVVDMGETAMDEETFNEYLTEMREQYTADKYHLLDFNCNSFTNDCIGFLTGGSIPDFIKDLPTDFLSTPFGQALRPTIDNMFRRPGASVSVSALSPAPQPVSNSDLAATLLQAVASRAASQNHPTPTPTSPPTPLPATQTLTAPVHISSNPASFNSVLKSHRAVVAFFTSTTCPPCRMIEPIFEELAGSKVRAANGIAFTKVVIDVGGGNAVASQYRVNATPTFLFFLDSKQISVVRGVNAPELRTQVDLLLYEAFPPHPHTRLSLLPVEALSLDPILFKQVPVIDSVNAKLSLFIDAVSPWPASAPQSQSQIKQTLTQAIMPYLKSKFPLAGSLAINSAAAPTASPGLLVPWARVTSTLADCLPLAELFPLVDLWRLAFLDPSVSSWCSALPLSKGSQNPIATFLIKATSALSSSNAPRNYMLTFLRLLCNSFANVALARILLSEFTRDQITTLLVTTLLHEDVAIRTAAASLVFNVAAYLQKGRVEKVRSGGAAVDGPQEDGDWEVELVSAVIEAIGREKANEEIVHRLTASLAFLLRLSPFYTDDLGPLLEALQSRSVLRSKLAKGGCGPNGIEKKEIRKLVEVVADKLCP